VTSLAALALFDGEAEITSDNISALIAGSNNTVAPYWPVLFASLLKKGRIDSFIFSGGVGGGASAEAAPAVAGIK
jgi:ribosomal protein L12E/L44/L45/RPP1/RPP2